MCLVVDDMRGGLNGVMVSVSAQPDAQKKPVADRAVLQNHDSCRMPLGRFTLDPDDRRGSFTHDLGSIMTKGWADGQCGLHPFGVESDKAVVGQEG